MLIKEVIVVFVFLCVMIVVRIFVLKSLFSKSDSDIDSGVSNVKVWAILYSVYIVNASVFIVCWDLCVSILNIDLCMFMKVILCNEIKFNILL